MINKFSELLFSLQQQIIGGMGHGTSRENNPWMKLMGIVSHKDRQHNQQSQSASNDRALNM